MASKRSRQAFEADLQKKESPFVFYGTPLPPLDGEVRDDGSFVPVWKQEVTDDRGRKRLHGAFTGGFSAGYYNTVGSKEGWTPSAFVSSRQNRMKDSKTSKQMQPEDFMDEEDLRDAEEGRQLETSESFAGFGTEHDNRRRDALMDLFRPPGETVGVKLLRKMGWKEGQSIGQTRRQKVGHENGADTSSECDGIFLHSKSDLKGLGFEEEGKSLPDTSSKRTETQGRENNQGDSSSNARPRLAQKVAFGVGVLNDTGSDDEDPYSMGPQISYNRVIGGDKKPKRKVIAAISSPNPTLKSKPVFLSKKLANLQGALRKCHDGRLPLDGFVLGDDLDAMGSLSLQNDKHWPPDVPQGWKSSLVPEDPEYAPGNSQTAGANRMSSLDAKTRASLLGEAQLPGKSVFDYLSPAARDRLVQASGKGNLPQALGEKPPEGYGRRSNVNLQDFVPKLDQDVALQALNRGRSGWMPYAEDVAKRERYKAYLEIRTGLRPTEEGDELPARADGMKIEDWAVEMQEFARAAQVFKPVTGQMASRFMSSTSSIPNSSEPNSSATTDFLLSKPRSKPEDPAETAATMGMFGQMTRSFANFYPTRLLCKRFNVPMPEHADVPPQSSVPSFTPETSTTLGRSRFESAGFQEDNEASPIARSEAADSVQFEVGSSDISRVQRAQLSAISIDPETNAALEKDRPGQALFKAIFGSDGSDSD